jgi:hypothetical protein
VISRILITSGSEPWILINVNHHWLLLCHVGEAAWLSTICVLTSSRSEFQWYCKLQCHVAFCLVLWLPRGEVLGCSNVRHVPRLSWTKTLRVDLPWSLLAARILRNEL